MLVLEKVLAILQIISAVIVMFLVLLQSDKSEGNIVTGSAESSNGMGMSRDKKLARLTAWVGTAFIILTIATSTIMLYNIH